MNIFETACLEVGYGKKTILNDINFELQKGEIICLMGPNGSGKSTILKTISRHIEKLGGNVYFQDKSFDKISAKDLAKQLSVVLTERINPELMTAAEVVASGRYPYTNYMGKLGEKDFEIIDDSIKMVNADDLREKYFTELSDGQKQRIMLARAICQEADIMILDEPTSFLDVRYKIELLGILRKLAREYGKTIILSLHEIDLIPKIANKVLLIGEDRSYIYGRPENIIKDSSVKEAFGINMGTFSTLIGNIELSKIDSEPDTFILGGEGKGTEIYRILNKEGKNFYTGVLFENDLDMVVAESLAEEVICTPSFYKIEDDKLQVAKSMIDRAEIIIDVGISFAGINEGNESLLEYSLKNRKKVYSLINREKFPAIKKVSVNEIANIFV